MELHHFFARFPAAATSFWHGSAAFVFNAASPGGLLPEAETNAPRRGHREMWP